MISTGLQKLDEILHGGIPTSAITDIYGESGTGKTQLLLQICINAVKKGGKVLFLDTTGGFRPERILQMQKDTDLGNKILDQITISRITNTSEQIKSIQNIQGGIYSLVVIDNITDLFSYEYPSEKSIFEKNFIFIKHMHELSSLAIEHNIPIVITNMIRHINNEEIENMQKAIDLSTHIKIRLYKESSKYKGEVSWLLNLQYFSYIIDNAGLSDNTEDF
ncbi:MAG: ATPase domain-containing protein [Nitrosopumilaceae archaeon]|nr:ATPase domain-containing protein [Nitrosopumilaceae archaeon]